MLDTSVARSLYAFLDGLMPDSLTIPIWQVWALNGLGILAATAAIGLLLRGLRRDATRQRAIYDAIEQDATAVRDAARRQAIADIKAYVERRNGAA